MARQQKTGASRPHRKALSRGTMEPSVQRWMRKVAHSNYWRVADWYDVADLLQDGWMCWQIVLTRYPKVRDSHHLTRLFQTTYVNYIHKLANRRTATPEQTLAMEQDYARAEQLLIDNHAELMTFLAEAPPPVRHLLRAIDADPALLARPLRRTANGRRESTNSWLCSLIGLNPEAIDLATMLNGYLGRAV